MSNEWIKYSGSDEQIAELFASKYGYLYRNSKGYESGICKNTLGNTGLIFISKEDQRKEFNEDGVTHYWIIPADPLREMKVRQAMTGQPVWVRYMGYGGVIGCTNNPNWNIPNAEYSFTEFKD